MLICSWSCKTLSSTRSLLSFPPWTVNVWCHLRPSWVPHWAPCLSEAAPPGTCKETDGFTGVCSPGGLPYYRPSQLLIGAHAFPGSLARHSCLIHSSSSVKQNRHFKSCFKGLVCLRKQRLNVQPKGVEVLPSTVPFTVLYVLFQAHSKAHVLQVLCRNHVAPRVHGVIQMIFPLR